MNIYLKTRIIGLLAGLAWIVSSCASVAQQPYGGNISFNTFYQELSPYGSWVNNPRYGQVWLPDVAPGFRPYQTQGHWVMTEYGNTWVSDYAWGWAPFHYGRWYLDDYYGWMWVPGNEWGPAWVAWRSGGGYYGWAPLSPGLNVNVSVNIGRRIPRSYWTFVQHRYITSPRIYDYCVSPRRVVNVINHTTVINNTYVYNNQHRYYSGPQRRDIEQVTHRSVPVRRVQDARRPGATSVRGGSVAMYRPTVRTQQGNSRSIAPASSRSGNDVSRSNNPTRSSYGRSAPRSTQPAVRSSRSLDSSTRSEGARQRTDSPDVARSLYDNRSERAPATSRDPQVQPRSSGSSRGEGRRVPSSSPSRTRSSYGERPSSNNRSVRSSSSTRTRSTNSTRSASPRSSSPAVSSPSRSRSSGSSGRSSAPSVSRPNQSSTTRSAPSSTRSRSTTSSSSSGRSGSSVQSGSSRSRSRPQ